MNIDWQSFKLGAAAGAGGVLCFLFVLFILKPWRQAWSCGAPVPLAAIVGMRLRGHPPALLIEAYIKLRKMPVEISIAEVEVEYLKNRTRALSSDALVSIIMAHRKKEQG